MARLALFAFCAGFGLAWWLCTRKQDSPCPEYKVYGEREVSELEAQANERKAIKGLST